MNFNKAQNIPNRWYQQGVKVKEDLMKSQDANTRQGTTQTRVSTRQKESVSIDISGKRLSIRTNHDPEFVQELAGYIEQKLQALQRAAPTAPFDKLMMLVSMTVAEELFSTREELEGLQQGVHVRAQAMMDILDNAS